MEVFQIITPPVIGAIIGYITNDIAIKMLFRPRKAVFIGKWQLPFTPGLIPKEKNRVAKSIGNVISTQLLNSEVIANTLTSNEMLEKIRGSLVGIIEKNKNNHDTIEEAMLKFTKKELIEQVISDIKNDLAAIIHSKLTNLEFGEGISKTVLEKVRDRIDNSLFSVVSNFIDDGLINTLAKNIGELINKAIADDSEEIIKDIIESEVDKLRSEKVCDFIEKYKEKLPKLIEFVLETYKNIIENNLSQILNGINIAKIVEDRVSSFEVVELEEMIFGIMKRELKAIVYLGALLGFVMGFVNLLIKF